MVILRAEYATMYLLGPSRTATEQSETLQRRESRKVFHAVRQSAISLNYEEKDIEDAASILSEDPSVILDVDPIILRSKVYQKYHPERYQRMVQRFPSRTSTSSTQDSSTQKTAKTSRHTRKKSIRDDPILPDNMGLPFLGIPFQGESTPDPNSETESEPEHATLQEAIPAKSEVLPEESKKIPKRSEVFSERSGVVRKRSEVLSEEPETFRKRSEVFPRGSEAVSEKSLEPPHATSQLGVITNQVPVDIDLAKIVPPKYTDGFLKAVQEEPLNADVSDTTHSEEATHEESMGLFENNDGSRPMNHNSETNQSRVFENFQNIGSIQAPVEPSSASELEPPIVDPPEQPALLHRSQLVKEEAISTGELHKIEENAPIDLEEKSELSSERSWHASDISDLYSDSETRESRKENKEVQNEDLPLGSKSPSSKSQSNIKSIETVSSKVSQHESFSRRTPSDQDARSSTQRISRSTEAPRLDYIPDRHPLGIDFDFGSGPVLDIIAPTMPNAKINEATEGVDAVGSHNSLPMIPDSTPNEIEKDHIDKDAKDVPSNSDKVNKHNSMTTQEHSHISHNSTTIQEHPSGALHNSTTTQEPSSGSHATLETELANIPPTPASFQTLQSVHTLPILRLNGSKAEESAPKTKDTTNSKRRVSTSSVPNFSYDGHESSASFEPDGMLSRSLTSKLPRKSAPSVPPSPKRPPPPVPPRPSRLTNESLAEAKRSGELGLAQNPTSGLTRSKLSNRRAKPPPIPPLLPKRRLSSEYTENRPKVDTTLMQPPPPSPTSRPTQIKSRPTFDDSFISKQSLLGPSTSFSRPSTPSIRSEVIDSVESSANSTVSSNDQGTSQTKATSVSEITSPHPAPKSEETNGGTDTKSELNPEQLKVSQSLGILVEKKPERSFKRFSKLSGSMMRFIPLGSSDKSTKLTKLAYAAEKGDLPPFRAALKALDRPSDAQTPVSIGSEKIALTPLMRAATGGYVACMEELSHFDMDCSAVDKTGRTAMHHALQARKSEAAQWLMYYEKGLKHVPSANQVVEANSLAIADKDGIMPVHLAAGLDQAETLDAFVNEGVDFLVRDSLGRLPLHFAVQKQSLSCVKYLGERMDNVDETDVSGETPLLLAAKVNGQNSVRFLLDHNADKNRRDVNGDYAIHHAARNGHLTVLEMLFLSLDDLEVKNNRGERPLHLACADNHLRIVRAILGVGCQVNPYTDPPHMRPSTKSKADISETSRNLASTPLHYACRCGFYDIVDLLIRKGAMVNANQEDGMSPLMLACNADSAGTAELLLKSGANPNSATSKERLTALHISVRRNDLDTTKRLISYGADPRAKLGNREGDTPAGLGLRENKSDKQEALTYVLAYNRQTWRAQNPGSTPYNPNQETGRRLGPEGSAYAAPYTSTSEQTYSYTNLTSQSIVRARDFQEYFSPSTGGTSTAPPSYADSQAQTQGNSERPTKQ